MMANKMRSLIVFSFLGSALCLAKTTTALAKSIGVAAQCASIDCLSPGTAGQERIFDIHQQDSTTLDDEQDHRSIYYSTLNHSTTTTSEPWPDTIKFAVDYYPSQWPKSQWRHDAQRMVNASIPHVRISEFDWALLEPREGEYDWSLLDESIHLLSKEHGLKVILGTPTATPPIWIVEKYDILGKTNELHTRRFGSRRHYSFSSPDYQKLSVGIVEAMAKRYGNNPAVAAWQLDNEYGNTQTARSFDKHATQAFQRWLEKKYGTIEELNERQGRVFWSSQFTSFDQILAPTLENEESSPALRLDFFHFSSDQLIAFAASHAQAIRRIAKRNSYKPKPITTNFMGFEFSYDHFEFARRVQIDFATWDSYPLGNAESLPWGTEDDKVRFARTGLPDHQALQHSIFRGVAGARSGEANGAWGVMEQQPGPVNWATSNPSPAQGQIRLWLHDMLSQGSSLCNIFRWRQVPFAQEQMHAGMLRPDDVYDVAWHEQQETVRDLDALRNANVELDNKRTPKAQVAIIVDFTSHWFIEAQPQSGKFQTSTFVDYTFQYGQVLSNWHAALRRLAIDVDMIAPTTKNLSAYKLLLIPTMVNMSHELDVALQTYKGEVIVGPRTASKLDPMTIPKDLAPSASKAFQTRLPIKVTRVESIREGGLGDKVTMNGPMCTGDAEKGNDKCTFDVNVWSEWLDCSLSNQNMSQPASFTGYRDGAPAMCTHTEQSEENGIRQTSYIGWYAFADSLIHIFREAAMRLQISNVFGHDGDYNDVDLGEFVRFARRGNALFAFNYNDKQSADLSSVLSKQTHLLAKLKLIVGGGPEREAHIIGRSGVNIYQIA